MKNKNTQLSRRRFLELTALSAGGAYLWQSNTALAAQSIASSIEPVTDIQSKSLNEVAVRHKAQCVRPQITSRLFSSSNTGTDEARNELGLQRLSCAGFDIQNPEVTRRQYLRFGGTDQQRASDLQNIATGAIEAPKLLMAARGGYGAMRLLKLVDWESLGQILEERQTILVGFSDVSAVQCALLAKGNMSSLAGPMLYSEFGKQRPDVESCKGFVEAITTPNLELILSQHDNPSSLNTAITGKIWGGNLSVVSALAGTPYMPNPDGGIVFLEDVGEQPYQVERMLYSLYLSGAFDKQQAIVLGTFTGTGSDSYDNRYDMSLVIEQLKQVTGLPVYSELHFGHVARKQSFPLGALCTLAPSEKGITLTFSDYPTIDKQLLYPKGLWT